MSEVKLDWHDITLVPAEQSVIKSRKSVNVYATDTRFSKHLTLPIISAPMDSVISGKEIAYNPNIVDDLLEAGVRPCIPRSQEAPNLAAKSDVFISYSLDEVKKMLLSGSLAKARICIDMANGHMKDLADTIKQIKVEHPEIVIMAGNIANPFTYIVLSEAGCDYIRVGIGGGGNCTTSVHTGIHYPMASLIHECAQAASRMQNPAKIVCDGGISSVADFVKALALGADFVMMGGLIAKTLDSDSVPYIAKLIPIKNQKLANWLYSKKFPLWKKSRGMSTQEVQKDWQLKTHGKIKELKYSEGIVKWSKVHNTITTFVQELEAYLRSAMSYSNARTLEEFKENATFIQITPAAFARFKK